MSMNQSFKPNYLPTPEEIAAACTEIQRGWTRIERRLRYWRARSDETVQVAPPFEVPCVALRDVFTAA